jgi:hypothetical protein
VLTLILFSDFYLHSEDLLTNFRKPSSGSWVLPSVPTLEGDLFNLRHPEITKSIMLRACQAEQQPIVGLHCLEENQEAQNLINTSTNLGVCFYFKRYKVKRPETKKLQVNSNI